jgi:hypothetical protein
VRAALVIALVLASTGAGATPLIPIAPPVDVARLQLRYRSARIQRDLGWGLAALGLALAAAGSTTAVYGAYQDGYNVAGLITGVSLAAAGAAFIIPGIVLALRGQDAMTDVGWRMRAVPLLAPLRSGPGASAGGVLVGVVLSL